MSHVATVQCSITNLDALEEALKKFGATLTRDAKTFRFYGGQKSPCVHKITLDDDKGGHEVGLTQKTTDVTDGFNLAYDVSFATNVNRKLGQNCTGLQNEYTAQVAEGVLTRRGYRIQREEEAGQIVLVAS